MLPTSAEEAMREALARRESEIRCLRVQEAARRVPGGQQPTMWRWRVEPGKEETFEHLRSWFLPNGRAAVERTGSGRRLQEIPDERRPAFSRDSSFVRGGARLVGRALLRAGQRLLQWGGGADEIEASAA